MLFIGLFGDEITVYLIMALRLEREKRIEGMFSNCGIGRWHLHWKHVLDGSLH